jgi:dihydrofolate synthase / folylpolyglutamate synthase
MSYSEAIKFLYSLSWFGAKFGLAITFKLAELAGNPQHHLRFVHVAGTNGKGSTCAMLESIYRAMGLRVGLFTSPHLVGFCERIQVNRRFISEPEVADLVSRMQPLLKEFTTADHPTFFEVATVMALRHFAVQKCDLVIWETGLGGRLDATNIVQPLLSVITNIQFDHQKYLGETLASIAAEKAGIIKARTPVVTGTDVPEALEVLRKTADTLQAPFIIVPRQAAHQPPLNTLSLPLLGEHQRMNAAVALAAVRQLRQTIPCTEPAERKGLSQVYWPGRLQLVTRPSGQKVLLDGAHNLSGAESLAAALRQDFPGTKPVLVLGILQDKDWTHMCQVLAPLASRLILVPVHSERTAQPHGLAEACHAANPQATVSECASVSEALAQTVATDFVAIAGSLYLIGEAMEVLHLSPASAAGERGLNEWTVRETSDAQRPHTRNPTDMK